MKKTLLQEVKAMNKIAGTELTKEQEIKLIKERLEELDEYSVGDHGGEALPPGQMVLRLLIGIGSITALSGTLIAIGLYGRDLLRQAKDAFHNWNRGRELDPKVVKGIITDFQNKIKNSKLSRGQKAYVMRYVNDLAKTDTNDRTALSKAETALIKVAKEWRLSENKKNEKKSIKRNQSNE
jgi:hypothetical protein